MALNAASVNGLAADSHSLDALKLQAGQGNPAAVKEAARQFESLFMRELIKSMREASVKSGLLDSPQSNLTTDLLDQQLALKMSGLPGGLSDAIVRQFSQQMGGAAAAPTATPTTAAPTTATPTNAASGKDSVSATGTSNSASPPAKALHTTKGMFKTSASSPRTPASVSPKTQQTPTAASPKVQFVQRLGAIAKQIEQSSGIPAGFMLGQAGLESGWGQHEIRNADGSASYNLFGIKAGSNWKGKVATVTTTEYVNGQPKKTVAKFRAYDSYQSAFQDFANLITQSPRYAQVKQNTGSAVAYAASLQQAGYATDPAYAAKLSQTINSALRVQRANV